MSSVFDAIIGHTWAAQRLLQALARGTLAQSHLFIGAQSIGKTTLALALASAVIEQGAANTERTRKLVRELRHPDLNLIRAEGDHIKVEQVREMLHTLALSPVESTFRVVIIERADLMTDAGKNAILKTLEEPNPRVILILTAPNVESVLPTIASRCAITVLRAVPQAAICEALIQRHVEPERAKTLATHARGRAGWAISAAESSGMEEQRAQRTHELTRVLRANRTERLIYAGELAKHHDDLDPVLEDWMRYWRDELCAGRAQPGLAHSAMNAILQARKRIDRNVNARLTLDVLMLELPF